MKSLFANWEPAASQDVSKTRLNQTAPEGKVEVNSRAQGCLPQPPRPVGCLITPKGFTDPFPIDASPKRLSGCRTPKANALQSLHQILHSHGWRDSAHSVDHRLGQPAPRSTIHPPVGSARLEKLPGTTQAQSQGRGTQWG